MPGTRMETHSVTRRLVLQNVDRNRETLQYVRACLGLAAVRAGDHEWDEVRTCLRLLDGLDLRQYKAEQDRLSALREMLPHPRS
jgi:MoxR-like ATPase